MRWDFQEFLTLEDGADSLSRNVCMELSLYAGNTPEEGMSQDGIN